MRPAAQPPRAACRPCWPAALLALWLLLNRRCRSATCVLGLVLAVAPAPGRAALLRPLQPQLRRAHLAGVLLVVVLRDIVRSNFNVARIVLGFGAAARCARGS